MNLFEDLIPETPDPGVSVSYGTVTDDDPLRVRMDGDSSALPITPASTVVCAVDDRVVVLRHGAQVTVLGIIGGTPAPEPYEPPDPVMRAQAGQVTLSFTSGSTVKETSNITFSPAFAATPRILLTLAQENGDIILSTTDQTASVFKVRGTRLSNTFAQNVAVDWLAIPDGALTL